MCNRIQGRTPVFGSCLVLVFRCVLDAVSRLLLRQRLVSLMWTQMDMWWGWALSDFGVLRCSSVVIYGLVFLSVLWYLRLTIVCWDPSDFWGGSVVLCWHCLGSVGGLFLRWILLVSSSEPSLADQISAWGRLWSMNSWVMASMMNYLIKNISELFIVLYDHIAIYSESAWPTFSKADTETDCSSQKLHMFRHGFPLPSLSTGWPGFGGKRIGFAF